MIKVTKLKRVFRKGGTEYPDPAPSATAEVAVEMLAAASPDLTNAILEGPTVENGKAIYTLKVAVGTKG